MPLIKSASPQAFKSNLKAEIASGRPRAQSLAIAYRVQRDAGRKGFADGGAVSFDTPLSAQEEMAFHKWKALNAPQDSGTDYDLRGAYKAGLAPAANGHWPDTFKKPNHPTFSNESIYAAQMPEAAGRWRGDEYVPPIVVNAERAGMKNGGAINVARRINFDAGGSVPFYARSAARNIERSGMVHSPTGGRSDQLPANVKSGSFVMPADSVSSIGGGNSMAGAAALNKLFKMAPGGATMPHPSMGGGMKIPTAGMMKGRKGFADGGETGAPVDISLSGGEFVVPVEKVAELGGGDVDRGHALLNQMVQHIRKKTIKTLRKLPKPKS